MRTCLDTNAYTALAKNESYALSVIRQSHIVFLTFVTVAELRAGFRLGKKSAQNEKVFQRFINSDRVQVIYPDEQTTHHYATVFRQLRTQGTPIPINDLWIASLVMQHDLILYTHDTHFDHLPQLPRVQG